MFAAIAKALAHVAVHSALKHRSSSPMPPSPQAEPGTSPLVAKLGAVVLAMLGSCLVCSGGLSVFGGYLEWTGQTPRTGDDGPGTVVFAALVCFVVPGVLLVVAARALLRTKPGTDAGVAVAHATATPRVEPARPPLEVARTKAVAPEAVAPLRGIAPPASSVASRVRFEATCAFCRTHVTFESEPPRRVKCMSCRAPLDVRPVHG